MMKHILLASLLFALPMLAFAATSYTVKRGDTLYKIAAANHVSLTQVIALNPQIKNKNLIYPGQAITLSGTAAPQTTSTQSKTTQTLLTTAQATVNAPTPVPVPALAVVPAVVNQVVSAAAQAGEMRMRAYLTGYGWSDNTPAGAAISNPVIHQTAGGTGTFADPITLAVGHSIISGKDILDYPEGTKFYVPNLRKYFIAEDTCGDGNQPQNGPCHSGYQGHVWLDLWVGGQGQSSKGTLTCEDTITDIHTVIVNPASNYAVAPGAVYSGSCAQQFGDTIVTQ